MCHVTGKQLKLLSHETVHRNWIKPVATEKALNSRKCLITMYIVGLVIIYLIKYSNEPQRSRSSPFFERLISVKSFQSVQKPPNLASLL